MDEDNVFISVGWQGSERVGDRILASVAAGNHFDLVEQAVFGEELVHASLLRGAHGDVNTGYERDGKERPKRVNEDGQAPE